VLGLVLAWGATVIAQRTPTERHTYGLRSSTVLAALANALLLLVAVGGIAMEAIERLRSPAPTSGLTVVAVAAVGAVINGVSALFFLRERQHDVNVRGAFLHLSADAAISLGVVVAGVAMWKTSWLWIDPAVSLAISVAVLLGTWGLLKEASHLALAGVPPHIDLPAVKAYLESLPDVCEVHDLHIWAMSTTEVALTAHLVMPWGDAPPSFLQGLDDALHERFGIGHSTVQIEPISEGAACRQTRESTV
jgi:cobalt-zinc-cadmium efflux system protein